MSSIAGPLAVGVGTLIVVKGTPYLVKRLDKNDNLEGSLVTNLGPEGWGYTKTVLIDNAPISAFCLSLLHQQQQAAAEGGDIKSKVETIALYTTAYFGISTVVFIARHGLGKLLPAIGKWILPS